MDANSQLEPSIIEIIPNPTVSKKICKTTYELLKKMCNLIFQHTLMIYMLFNGLLLFLLVSKNLNSHLLVYLWMFSSLFLFVFKLYEFLQQARVNEVRSFQILENLRSHVSNNRNLINNGLPPDRIGPQNQPLTNQIYEIFDMPPPDFGRFPEYQTVFNNILRLRVHALAMRMNLMLHALYPGIREELNTNRENGLSQTQIDNLESEIYEKTDEDIECTICLEKINEGEEIRKLECLHIFHKICIDKWLGIQKLCPYCRHIIT